MNAAAALLSALAVVAPAVLGSGMALGAFLPRPAHLRTRHRKNNPTPTESPNHARTHTLPRRTA